jgi:hypothetical protein
MRLLYKMENLTLSNVIKKYTSLDIYIDDISNDINNLINLHKTIVLNSERKDHFHRYGIYIDDIYFQQTILTKELKNMTDIRNQCIRKFYGDLFRLYIRIIRRLISLDKELHGNLNQESYIAKYLTEPQILIFNELDEKNIYDMKNIEFIFTNIEKRIEELKSYATEINSIINSTNNKISDGYLIKSFIVGLSSEKSKVDIDISLFVDMIQLILENNMKLSEKYSDYAKTIADELKDNAVEFEKKVKLILEDPLNNLRLIN